MEERKQKEIRLIDLKHLIWHGGMLAYRLFDMVDNCVTVDSLPLLWETPSKGEWAEIGGKKFDEYFVQEIQTNKKNTLDIIISKEKDSDC